MNENHKQESLLEKIISKQSFVYKDYPQTNIYLERSITETCESDLSFLLSVFPFLHSTLETLLLMDN